MLIFACVCVRAFMHVRTFYSLQRTIPVANGMCSTRLSSAVHAHTYFIHYISISSPSLSLFLFFLFFFLHTNQQGHTLHLCFLSSFLFAQGYKTTSLLCMPIPMSGVRVGGVIEVLNKLDNLHPHQNANKPQFFDKNDEITLDHVCKLVCCCVCMCT